MRRRTGSRGFYLGLGFTLLWQSGWAVLALVVWLLHRWKGSSLLLCWIALSIWLLSALIAVVLIYFGSRRINMPSPAQENQNPYSADNARVFLGVASDTASVDPSAPSEPVRTIVLVMWRRAVAQGLAHRLRNSPNLCLIFEPSHSLALNAVRSRTADTVLVEVAESGERHGISDCLAFCARLRSEAPQCKLLLMCPENDRCGVSRVVEAKRAGHIDDFLFYDSSIDYLAAKLLAL